MADTGSTGAEKLVPRRIKITVPARDTTTNQWLDLQDNASASVRHLIREYVRTSGVTDPLVEAIEMQSGAGRPSRAEMQRRQAAVIEALTAARMPEADIASYLASRNLDTSTDSTDIIDSTEGSEAFEVAATAHVDVVDVVDISQPSLTAEISVTDTVTVPEPVTQETPGAQTVLAVQARETESHEAASETQVTSSEVAAVPVEDVPIQGFEQSTAELSTAVAASPRQVNRFQRPGSETQAPTPVATPAPAATPSKANDSWKQDF